MSSQLLTVIGFLLEGLGRTGLSGSRSPQKFAGRGCLPDASNSQGVEMKRYRAAEGVPCPVPFPPGMLQPF
jgi:hypothetical protein